jgi:hypothetical protein
MYCCRMYRADDASCKFKKVIRIFTFKRVKPMCITSLWSSEQRAQDEKNLLEKEKNNTQALVYFVVGVLESKSTRRPASHSTWTTNTTRIDKDSAIQSPLTTPLLVIRKEHRNSVESRNSKIKEHELNVVTSMDNTEIIDTRKLLKNLYSRVYSTYHPTCSDPTH